MLSDFHDNRPSINVLSTRALTIIAPDIDMMSGATVFIRRFWGIRSNTESTHKLDLNGVGREEESKLSIKESEVSSIATHFPNHFHTAKAITSPITANPSERRRRRQQSAVLSASMPSMRPCNKYTVFQHRIFHGTSASSGNSVHQQGQSYRTSSTATV